MVRSQSSATPFINHPKTYNLVSIPTTCIVECVRKCARKYRCFGRKGAICFQSGTFSDGGKVGAWPLHMRAGERPLVFVFLFLLYFYFYCICISIVFVFLWQREVEWPGFGHARNQSSSCTSLHWSYPDGLLYFLWSRFFFTLYLNTCISFLRYTPASDGRWSMTGGRGVSAAVAPTHHSPALSALWFEGGAGMEVGG